MYEKERMMDVKKVLEMTAAQSGVTVAEVRREIAAAIDAGMRSTSPEAVLFWKSVPRSGEKPTPEELLDFFEKNYPADL